jgi:hypothetical protein
MKKPITLIWFHEHSYFYFTWFGSQKIGMTSNLEGSIVYRLGNTINLSVLVFLQQSTLWIKHASYKTDIHIRLYYK